MKVFAVLALMLGLCVVTLIVGHYGFAAVGSTLLLVGWTGFLAILLIHIGVMVLFGICWWILLPPSARPSLWVFVWSRFVRDGGSEALPLSRSQDMSWGRGPPYWRDWPPPWPSPPRSSM